ncbi:hypothetical protein B0181_06505 [Moraxella caviae]|uniref:Uncharacterized protein n=1 Tax=Moraxella caviae TaxID=34060 RepID=A0A1T0A1N3_9GAMM|nr:hypothetical protein [Moraxella caviae]OOR89614.1 hypothetical protein B0181_06505 [Moraxella caviae]STZ10301.1 Uncharacterised protein [Moraxella caviae]
MIVSFQLDDHLARLFLENTTKEKRNSLLSSFVADYLSNSAAENHKNTPLDFVGMWADSDIKPNEFAHTLRQGRDFRAD